MPSRGAFGAATDSFRVSGRIVAPTTSGIQSVDTNMNKAKKVLGGISAALVLGASSVFATAPDPATSVTTAVGSAEDIAYALIGVGIIVLTWRIVRRFSRA